MMLRGRVRQIASSVLQWRCEKSAGPRADGSPPAGEWQGTLRPSHDTAGKYRCVDCQPPLVDLFFVLFTRRLV